MRSQCFAFGAGFVMSKSSAQQPTTAAPFVIPSDSRKLITQAEVAAWLAVHPRQVPRLGVPRAIDLHRTKRYRVADVQDWIIKQSKKRKRA